MNYKDACRYLEIDEDVPLTIEHLKQQYRRMALKHHPDKNQTKDATQFICIQTSYEYLLKHIKGLPDIHTASHKDDYQSLLFSFLKDVILNQEERIKEKWLYMILFKITNIVDKPLLDFLNLVNLDLLIKIYDIINTYKDVLNIPDDFIVKIAEIVSNKIQQNECIILNPFIEDLLEDNLYKLTEKNHKCIIPLWHHELVYDISGQDMYVRCFPLLPDNVKVDEYNNVHVAVTYAIKDIFGTEKIDVKVGNMMFFIHTKDISLTKTQKKVFKDCGISRINTKNIYDVSKRGDIIVNLTLTLGDV
jgi:hypothetical protein